MLPSHPRQMEWVPPNAVNGRVNGLPHSLGGGSSCFSLCLLGLPGLLHLTPSRVILGGFRWLI